ncbi:endonuclease/exonuclease/phosphatase family protein [Brevirhabdus sp.]|uniref:endonuclease/exonuclease/phosphatase family protein n=1 Tax=Brevirhabdus sp. TaxID=2004514 RepID=UPI0040588CE4
MVMAIVETLLWLLTVACLAVSIAPFLPTHEWWVRMWDFPRIHIALAAAAGAVAGFALLRDFGLLAPVLLSLVTLYQLYKVLPYSPFVTKEITLIDPPDSSRLIRLMASNVLMENTRHDKIAALIESEDPDILLLMETDATWHEALREVLARYDTVLARPQDNYYGMIFATRLRVTEAEMLDLEDDDTPTLYAEMKAPDDTIFRFVGLHPRPPVPGEDTDERDELIRKSATFAHDSDVPVISMGDFNDVAWSPTAQKFREYGGYLDPRIGRGLISSFDANHALLRFPIDQLYLTPRVGLVSFRRGPNVGSDHFPMFAEVWIHDGTVTTAAEAGPIDEDIPGVS